MKTTNLRTNPASRGADKRFSKTGKMSVLVTGVAALVFFPIFAAYRAADAAVKNF